MTCPDDIAPAIIEIISTAILRIRAAGWSGDAELCAIEADHVHNLPALLQKFSPDLLHFYWNVERESFLRGVKTHALRKQTPVDFRAFENAWKLLEHNLDIQPRERRPEIANANATTSGADRTQWANR